VIEVGAGVQFKPASGNARGKLVNLISSALKSAALLDQSHLQRSAVCSVGRGSSGPMEETGGFELSFSPLGR